MSCPAACGIFPDQGLTLCPLHWQVGSLLLDHQGSPAQLIFDKGTKAIQWEEKCITPNAVGVTGHRGQKIEA